MKNGAVLAVVAVVAFRLGAMEPVDYVNPFVGSAGVGNTTPAAAYPFGMLQPGPDTGTGEWKYCAGYHHEDDELLGFSLEHFNGTGLSDLQDVWILPLTADLPTDGWPKAKMDKKSEVAKPGYYAVTLKDGGVRAEASATLRGAYERFTFPKGGRARLFVDLQRGMSMWHGFNKGKPRMLESQSAVVGTDGLEGTQRTCCWLKDRKMAFALRFSRQFASVREIQPVAEDEKGMRYVFEFDLMPGESVVVKAAVSVEGDLGAARANLSAETHGFDFERVVRDARAAWNRVLSAVTAQGDEDELRTFYTALYHTAFQPNVISDAGERRLRYSTFSCWDTFRAAHPLYTVLWPELAGEFAWSMMDQYRRTGRLTKWAFWGRDNLCMIAEHGTAVLTDAVLKGLVKGVSEEEVFAAVDATLSLREKHYDENRGYRFDRIPGSVARTLEYSFDDWCAMKLAERLGKKDRAAFYADREGYYRDYFDPETKCMRGRDSKGAWRMPFDPFATSGGPRGFDYVEGSANHYVWHVLQDIPRLVSLMGGPDAFEARLDQLFDESKAGRTGPDINCTGEIGAYAHGNEPGHHVPWLYAYTRHPEKGADIIRKICRRLYSPMPDGLCGNDDCGQMSAWYVFACAGFYPVNPCDGMFVLGAPQLPEVCFNLTDGKVFRVTAKNFSEKNRYVRRVTLDGREISGRPCAISYADVMKGGDLVFEMTDLDETKDLQSRIDAAFKAGGGEVVVSPGVHRVGGLRLRSKVTLRLARGAVLRGHRDAMAYDHVLERDELEPIDRKLLSWKPEYAKLNPVDRWNNAVIRLYRADDAAIIGEPGSAIDGDNAFYADGEEGFRGPHGICAFDCRRLRLEGYAVRHAGNWAHRLQTCPGLRMKRVTVLGGHDGVHVRGSDDIVIADCEFRTGDDGIAGFDNVGVLVTNCTINTACSGFRFAGTEVTIDGCTVSGPADYPHRMTLSKRQQRLGLNAAPEEGRRNTLNFLLFFGTKLQPPRQSPGRMTVRNCRVSGVDRFFNYNNSGRDPWQDGPGLTDIRFENCTATGLCRPFLACAPEGQPVRVACEGCRLVAAKEMACPFIRKNAILKCEPSAFQTQQSR